jgi:UDP:flavonoid glycosyltransferase YjiC (YdhE family)
MKALATGVPLVILPHGRDQTDTATRVTARGAGIALTRTATRETVAGAIQQVLQRDSYRIAARTLGDAVRREANSDALLQELENLSHDASADHRQCSDRSARTQR